MKKSELQRMIHEEYRRVLKEGMPDDPYYKGIEKSMEILDKYMKKPNPPHPNFHKNWASWIEYLIKRLENQRKQLLTLDKKG